MRLLVFAWHALQTAATEWLNDFCPRHAAALSYYTVFSLAPLLVILVGVVGVVFGEGTAHAQLVQEARHLAGEQAGQLVDALLKAAARPTEGVIASLTAFALLLFGATGVLVELREALDRIWACSTPRDPTSTGTSRSGGWCARGCSPSRSCLRSVPAARLPRCRPICRAWTNGSPPRCAGRSNWPRRSIRWCPSSC